MATTYELLSAVPQGETQLLLTVRVTKDGVVREGTGTVAADADFTVMSETIALGIEAEMDAVPTPIPVAPVAPVARDVSKVVLDPVRARKRAADNARITTMIDQ